ncbi:hypothetical protein [Oceanobacillus neutriphilus]|uniref:hypothetical protein n=1 Tax=Oceanobacillus neutriphilus TaxID=531815 RepID=UPI001E3DA7ED|nr:hypothetical protein [Oceanobacillus neutriphilus]
MNACWFMESNWMFLSITFIWRRHSDFNSLLLKGFAADTKVRAICGETHIWGVEQFFL